MAWAQEKVQEARAQALRVPSAVRTQHATGPTGSCLASLLCGALQLSTPVTGTGDAAARESGVYV